MENVSSIFSFSLGKHVGKKLFSLIPSHCITACMGERERKSDLNSREIDQSYYVSWIHALYISTFYYCHHYRYHYVMYVFLVGAVLIMINWRKRDLQNIWKGHVMFKERKVALLQAIAVAVIVITIYSHFPCFPHMLPYKT